MLIYPAIDLRGGRVVRLTQGDYDREIVYGDDPLEMAASFRGAGASCLHVVDLDGAREGSPRNRDVIRKLCATGVFVEVGGGMRDEAAVAQTLALGASRVIVGTMAVTDFELLTRLAARYPENLAVGVDVRDGFVATHGWKQTTRIEGKAFCERLRQIGVSTVIYTDIGRDGLLAGTNVAAYGALQEIEGLQTIASGGVTYEREIEALRDAGLYGVIVGKALYTGKLSLPRILCIAHGEGKPC